MAKLHITVYVRSARDATNALVPAPMAPPLDEIQLEIGLDSTQTEPFHKQATFIMVKPEAACCLAFGEDPVAVDGVHPVDAGEVRWYGVFPNHKLAVIESA